MDELKNTKARAKFTHASKVVFVQKHEPYMIKVREDSVTPAFGRVYVLVLPK